MKRFLTSLAVLFALLFGGGGLHGATPQEAAATVVVYNPNDPDAKALADFYCSARQINPANEISLPLPLVEEISRADYDEGIAKPLREEFLKRGYWVTAPGPQKQPVIAATRIRYLVLIRGIPLKIRQCVDYPGDKQTQPAPVGTSNAASVDSEISVLGLFTTQISGVLNNPVFNKSPGSDFTARVPASMLFVSRLDAPTADAVRTMVANGLKAEQEGLWGWGYIDLRSINTPGYVQGEQWIKEAGAALRRSGIPVISDDLPDTFQSGFPVTDPAAYFGWYSENLDGPFGDPFFQFLPGGVAFHLHSFSATTLHDPLKGWTGPLILHGASASVGNVYEPYLSFTTEFGVMASALLAERNLAESYYMAQPVLSWMSVLVGDPLYRPYASIDAPGSQPSVWTDYRHIILAHNGSVLKSAPDLVRRAKETRESLYLEALGAAQMDAGYLAPAEASFRTALTMARDERVAYRLLLEQSRAMEKQGKSDRAAALLRQGLLRFVTAPQRSLLLAWIARLDPMKAPAQPPPTPTGAGKKR